MEDGPDEDVRNRAAWFRRAFVDAALGPAWVVGVSLTSVGGLVHDLGLSAWVAALSTIIVWAGPGQLIYFASLSAGVAPVAMLTALTLAAVRFTPMVASLLPLIRNERTSLATQLFASHLVAVTAWVETMRRAPLLPRDSRMTYFFGFATGCLVISTFMTVVGFALTAYLPRPMAAGLLFLSPIYFVISLIRGAKEAMDWIALVLGLALAPLMQAWIGGGLDLLATGLIGGGLAYGWRLLARMKGAAS